MSHTEIQPIPTEPHPLLRPRAFATVFTRPLEAIPPLPDWAGLLRGEPGAAPLARSEPVRVAVRNMLRQRGYKPTGRGKPASEYLVRAADEGALRPINAAVDACNIVSLHSGLPISVVDLDRCRGPLAIRVAGEGERYVFNQAGQEIDVAGLPCLYDREGACGNAVKDAQRTKTHGGTERTLSVIWGVSGFEERTAEAVQWYCRLLGEVGAETEAAAIG